MGGVKCVTCNKNVTRYDEYLACSASCKSCFHISCVGVSESQFTDWKQDGRSRRWECGKCPPAEAARTSAPATVPATAGVASSEIPAVLPREPCRSVSIDSPLAADPSCKRCCELSNYFTAVIDDMRNKMETEMASFKLQLFDELRAAMELGFEGLKSQLGVKNCCDSSAPGTSRTQAPLGDTRNYAQALTVGSSVIIKPKNDQQSARTTKADLFREVNPIDSGVSISRVRHIKGGGLVIGCSSGDSAAKLEKEAKDKLSGKYTIREAGTVSPRIRIVGMTEEHDKDSLVNLLKLQNPHLFPAESDLKFISSGVVRRRRSGDAARDDSVNRQKRHIYQSVIQVNVDTYKKALSSPQVFIGYDCCSVYDAIEVTRCFKCSGFNHTSVTCKSATACPRCAGDHLVADCTSSSLKCVNCVNAHGDAPDNDIAHAAWDRECAVYQRKLKSFKAAVLNLD